MQSVNVFDKNLGKNSCIARIVKPTKMADMIRIV